MRRKLIRAMQKLKSRIFLIPTLAWCVRITILRNQERYHHRLYNNNSLIFQYYTISVSKYLCAISIISTHVITRSEAF